MAIPRWLQHPRLGALVPWLLGAVAAGIAANKLVGGYADLGIYLDVAREFRAGGIDIFRDRPPAGPWAYPHFAALPFVLLQALFDEPAIRWLWSAFLGVCTAFLLTATVRALRPFGGLRWWQWTAFGLLFQRGIAQNLTHGQLSLAVGTCVALGVADLVEQRDRRAGFWLGLAAALKLTPLLFVLALPCFGRWRATAAMAATIVVLVLLLPWPVCGTDEHLRHLADLARTIRSATVEGGATIVQAYAGPSVRGALDHLLQPRPVNAAGDTANLLAIGDTALQIARLCWSVVLAGLLGAWLLAVRRRPAAQRIALQCAAIELAMAFFAPLVRVYHLSATMLAFALFCRGPRDRRDGLWWCAAAAALFSMTLRQKNLLGETLWRAFDAGALLHLAMVLTLVWMLREDARSAATPER